MRKEVKLAGVDFIFSANAELEWVETPVGSKTLEIPLKPGRSEFGKVIIVPDFTEAMREIRRMRTMARL